MRCFLLFYALNLIGCAIQSNELPKEENQIINNSYNSNHNSVDTICPPPYNIIVVIDGVPTEQLLVPPCYFANSNKVILDKDWGSSEDHSFWIPESLPDINNPSPGDPIP